MTTDTTETSIHPNNLQSISRFTFIDQIILQHNFDTTRELTSRSSFRHLLDHDHLLVHERRETVFDFESVSFGVHLRVDGGSDGRSSGGGGGESIGVHSRVEVLGFGTKMDGRLHLWSNKITCSHTKSQPSDFSFDGIVLYVHLVTIPSRQTILPSLSARRVLGVV